MKIKTLNFRQLEARFYTVIKFKKTYLLFVAMFLAMPAAAINLPDVPLGFSGTAKPITLITAGRDHKLFYEAYNDASDIDGDGSLDIRFKPSITYLGLFDSNLCYKYKTADKVFVPKTNTSNGKCTNKWSGNWLNYVTTSRIDALRVVLYGGYREVDNNQTILRRAYIPQDAHSWAKEYTSLVVDGYDLSDYTPLSLPSSGNRHFFGNLTDNAGINCSNLDTCSNRHPLFSFIKNSPKRVWEWASKELPVLDNSHGGSRYNYSVRVKVCTPAFHEGCKKYPNDKFKPTGLLHDYGENDSMLFGLLTGSYNKNTSGGVLRKVVSSFKDEVNATNGIFTTNNTIVKTFDSLRIRDFNNGDTSNSYRPFEPDWDDPNDEAAWVATRPMVEGEFVDWGNPIAEMMYEGLRYFAGKGIATSDYLTSGSFDSEVGLSSTSWDNPYDQSNSEAKAEWCAKPNLLVVSDIHPSYDSDQLPGSYFSSGFSGDVSGLNVQTLLDTITANESDATGLHFIGQSGTDKDGAPTAKNVTSLGRIRGLSPEEPTKEGSYYSTSVAYFGKTNDINPADDIQTIDSFFVALASPLPQFEFPVNGKTITVVPFAKSVGGCLGISPTADFQPTNQIVDFYIDTLANLSNSPLDDDASINGGRAYIKFRINFEDVEQAADHDMDAIVKYEMFLTAAGELEIKVDSEYASGCVVQHIGYVISGTTEDGTYLVVRDEDTERVNLWGDYFHDVDYALDVPNDKGVLPLISSRTFTPGDTAATLLHGPLWYAAKWGGFIDKNDNNIPDLRQEWDADNNGVPDAYFMVQNPTKLKSSLKRVLQTIVERSSSSGNVTANSTSMSTNTVVFQSVFNSANWSGDILAYPVTSETGVADNPSWKVSEQVPAHGDRNIFTISENTKIEFDWDNLSATDQATLGDSAEIVDFLRGDRSQEILNGGELRDRNPNNILGDIIHSSPTFVEDINTVFASANDGMLHAFDATSGQELFAYIPSVAIDRLLNLSNNGYQHEYLVDGDISVSFQGQTPNKNYLVATLGHGGKGLFGLDVSTPFAFSTSDILWEYYDNADPDLGYMLGKPEIAKMNDGTMVAIVGNGYNSTSGKAVLYIFNLKTGSLIKKLDTLVGGDNGLSSPGAFDSDDDGDIDVIYAGDLKGNVWKFDVSDPNIENWNIPFNSGSPEPLFVAKNASNVVQPITAKITVARNDQGTDVNFDKVFIFFGTGSYIQTGDQNNIDTQSWYGLIDENTKITDRSLLVKRSVLLDGTFSGADVRTFTQAIENDMDAKSGWYIDLDTQVGERIITSSKIFELYKPALIASSIIPINDDPCIPGGKGFINLIDPFSGTRLGSGIIDVNNDGDFENDKLNDVFISSIDVGVAMPSEPVLIQDRLVIGGTSGKMADIKVRLAEISHGRRMSWRELIN